MTASTAPLDLTTATPVEVDTALAEVYERGYRARFETERTKGYFKDYEQGNAKREAGNLSYSSYTPAKVEEWRGKWQEAKAAEQAIWAETKPFNAEFERRGGWTRAFLVITSGKGHVHSSMSCTTCYPTTQYNWLPQLSGHDEVEIVKAAGADACTICYPSAPVIGALGLPRSVYSKSEQEKQVERDARNATKAARLAKKIADGLTDDGSEFRVFWIDPSAVRFVKRADGRGSDRVVGPAEAHEWFKTERSAVIWAVQTLADIQTGYAFKSCQLPGVEQVIEAVARKHGKQIEEVRADLNNKVAAKIKRDSR